MQTQIEKYKKSVLIILLTLGLSLYGLLHTRHFCTQYCDKKIILSHGCLKAKVSSELKLAQGTIRFFLPLPWCLKSLPWFLKSLTWLA